MNNSPTLRLAIGVSSEDIEDYLLVCESFGFIRCESLKDITIAINHGCNAICGDVSLTTSIGRKPIMQLCKDKVNIEGVIIAQPLEYCKYSDTIDRLIKSFQTPLFEEGFSSIDVFYPEDTDTLYGHWTDWALETMLYDQRNSHHQFTLGEHCLKCKENCENYNGAFKDELLIAAMLHDNGKPYVQSVDADGVAHYHNHTNVGAYNCFFYDTDGKDKILISQLISNHTDLKHILEYSPESILHQLVNCLQEADLSA